jgi:hypothetical protein
MRFSAAVIIVFTNFAACWAQQDSAVSKASSSSLLQCETDTATLNNEVDYSDYNTTLHCDTVTDVCTDIKPVARDLALCSGLGGVFYIGDLTIDCTGVAFNILNYGVCTATDCSTSDVNVIFNLTSAQFATDLMTDVTNPLEGCSGSANNILPATNNGTLGPATNAPAISPSSTVQPASSAPASSPSLSQCETDTATLNNEVDYSDYNTTLHCDKVTGVCTNIKPVARDLALCSGLGGVFYIGDLTIDCTGVAFDIINWGVCTATDCSTSDVNVIFEEISAQFASDLMNGTSPLEGCSGSANNILPATNNGTLGPATNAPAVSPSSTIQPGSSAPASSPSLSQCETDTVTLQNEVDYSDYNTTLHCDKVTDVCTDIKPVERDLALCSGLGGVFYIGDVTIECTGAATLNILNFGVCTATDCSTSDVNVIFNLASTQLASDLMTTSGNALQGCSGSANNILPATNNGTLGPASNLPAPSPPATAFPTTSPHIPTQPRSSAPQPASINVSNFATSTSFGGHRVSMDWTVLVMSTVLCWLK